MARADLRGLDEREGIETVESGAKNRDCVSRSDGPGTGIHPRRARRTRRLEGRIARRNRGRGQVSQGGLAGCVATRHALPLFGRIPPRRSQRAPRLVGRWLLPSPLRFTKNLSVKAAMRTGWIDRRRTSSPLCLVRVVCGLSLRVPWRPFADEPDWRGFSHARPTGRPSL